MLLVCLLIQVYAPCYPNQTPPFEPDAVKANGKTNMTKHYLIDAPVNKGKCTLYFAPDASHLESRAMANHIIRWEEIMAVSDQKCDPRGTSSETAWR